MTARRKRGWLGCLITAPLGCAAFFAGALAVGVALMPVACGRLLSRNLEEDFRAGYRGSIEVERARLPSFLGDQELSFVLEDPEGRAVLAATVSAPSLPWWSVESWGPLEVHLARVAIVVEADGRTNLEHALEARPGVPDSERLRFSLGSRAALRDGGEGLEIDFGDLESFEVVFSIDELSWRAAGAPESGFRLLGASGLGRIDLEGERELFLAGSASREAGEPPLGFQLLVREPAEGGGHELSLRLSAEEVAAELVDALLGTKGEVERTFGARIAPFSLLVEKPVQAPIGILLEAGSESRRVLGPRVTPTLAPVEGAAGG